MRIVQITTDNREHHRDYGATVPYFGAAPQALLAGFEKIPDVEVHVVSCLRAPVSSPAKLAPNIYYHPLLVPRIGWTLSGFVGCVRAARSLILDLRPDIVHGQGTERDCALSAVHSSFRNVVTIHGNMQELQRRKMLGHPVLGRMASALETHALKRTSGVFCNSAYTRELVTLRTPRTWLVPNPIRERFLSTRRSEAEAGDIPHLACVGVVTPRKRQLEILQAIGAIVREGTPLHLIFAGSLHESTPYGRAFAEELRKAEAAGYASFAGFLDEAALIGLMDRCSGFIHYPLEEAFGLVVAEAMARGLKFFGSDLGGIRDIARDAPGAELSTSFEELARNVKAWARAGGHRVPEAAEKMASCYAPEVIARRHVEIYRELLRT